MLYSRCSLGTMIRVSSATLSAVALSRPLRILLAYYSNDTTNNHEKKSDVTKKLVSDQQLIRPWYLKDVFAERTRSGNLMMESQVIKLPDKVPTTVIDITKVLQEDLGASGIVCFDTSKSHRENVKSGFIIIATVKSKKHGSKTVIELMKYLKLGYSVFPTKEGGVTAQEMRRNYKRLRRTGKFSSRNYIENGDSDWYLIDCKLKKSREDEVFVNLLTEEKRKDLNLEELYCTPEEKELYAWPETSKLPEVVEDTDNVLASLRNLALKNSKRLYSTSSAAINGKDKDISVSYDSLMIQDFNGSLNLKRDLKDIVHALSSLPSTIELDARMWVKLFEANWPFSNIMEFHWQLRWRFFELIYCNKLCVLRNAKAKGIEDLSPYFDELKRSTRKLFGYFEFKRAMGGSLTRNELIDMLDVINSQINLTPKYTSMTKRFNKMVVHLFSSYRYHDPSIIGDERIILRSLQTMVSCEANLHALYEYIEFIMDAGYATRNIVLKCIILLGEYKDWNRLFPFFFQKCLVQHHNDQLVWTTFLKYVIEKGNKVLWCHILDKGHLLWLKRYQVDLSPNDELHKYLLLLFEKIDPNSTRYAELKNYILLR